MVLIGSGWFWLVPEALDLEVLLTHNHEEPEGSDASRLRFLSNQERCCGMESP